jgi:5'-3' exoribonuclease 1
MVVVDIVTSAEICPSAEDPDKVIKEMRKWLKSAGLSELEPVSLFAEQLEKVSSADNNIGLRS